MSISNKTKRRLTCLFCDKQNKENCECKKYWKKIYHEHREEILKVYHSQKQTKKT